MSDVANMMRADVRGDLIDREVAAMSGGMRRTHAPAEPHPRRRPYPRPRRRPTRLRRRRRHGRGQPQPAGANLSPVFVGRHLSGGERIALMIREPTPRRAQPIALGLG